MGGGIRMPGSSKRTTLTISLLVLATAAAGTAWYLQRSESSTTANGIERAAPEQTEPLPPQISDTTVVEGSAVAADAEVGPATMAARNVQGREPHGHLGTPQLKPQVALALMETSKTTEELCPELAQKDDGKTSPDSVEAAKPHTDAKGCVLPIGSEPAANVQQAAIPLESGKPPAPFPRAKGFNFLPLAGGLGAAVAAVPVIGGLSDNKDSSQPVSPD